MSLRFDEVSVDRRAASSPKSDRVAVGTELVSYLVTMFTESRVTTVSFVKSAPSSVRLRRTAAAGRKVMKFDSGHFC